MFKLKINLDRHGPRPLPIICLLPGPHCFSFPSTFNVPVVYMGRDVWIWMGEIHNESLPLQTARAMDFPPSKSIRPAPKNRYFGNFMDKRSQCPFRDGLMCVYPVGGGGGRYTAPNRVYLSLRLRGIEFSLVSD
jgi:hypothetical protein